MDQLKTELVNAISEVIHVLSLLVEHQDLELCVTRVEVLAESALNCEGISLEDFLNQAVNLLKRDIPTERTYESYQAPLLQNESRRGMPKFSITEDQLLFFKGKCFEYS